MIKSKGISLTEYSIIIGLVILVLIPVLFVLGDKVYKAFQGYSDVWNSNPKNIEKQINPEVAYNFDKSTTPSQSITQGNSEKKCSNGYCEIDFGDFTLTGIPEDFDGYVETAGGPGLTDHFNSLINQIADSLKAAGNTEGYEEVKKLSGMGHNIAVIENQLEQGVTACNHNTVCIEEMLTKSMPRPEGYEDEYLPFSTNSTYRTFLYSLVGGDKDQTEPLRQQLDKISQNKGVSEQTMAVLRELAWNIGMNAENFEGGIKNILGDQSSTNMGDFVNETINYTYDPKYSDPFQNFESYNISLLSHYDSALICAAGKYKDTGKKCH